ncbi:hypothetical protein PROFUN_10490 [Planoprotostelium fungivorum]|uniref:Pectate lyase superfamily protein domain-containing protein n=1 Tax=Planoprotostelium fungivorum TaxID=1890364 RepID=A0A2P6NDF5_9EUKA|nr:hypothetical protein PROFUN_10490 [Planoprotostelium fungivorum]
MRVAGLCLLLCIGAAIAATGSDLVSVDSKGRLTYTKNDQGDRIMDYSSAGYHSGQAVPDASSIPNKVTVKPSGGDDTKAIKAAIDKVAALPLDSNGFRGAVLLAPGKFEMDSLKLSTSGVVVRGSGTDATKGTTLNVKGHMAFSVMGSTRPKLGSKKYYLTKTYVPFGGNTLPLQSTSGLKVGDTVYVVSTITSKFIHLLGMDKLVRDNSAQTWIKAGSSVNTDRIITAITNNTITLDAGYPDSIRPELFDSDKDLPYVVPYTWTDRLENVGVESMRAIFPATMETNYGHFLDMDKAYNCWVRDLYLQDFGTGVVTTQGDTKWVTIQGLNIHYTFADNTIKAPPQILSMLGTQILHRDTNITGGGKYWPMSSGSTRARGPTVHYNVNIDAGAGAQVVPHMRWSTGILYDNINNAKGTVAISYRGIMGSGHGWTMSWGVIWNCEAKQFGVQNPYNMFNASAPVLYHNWLVGGKGTNVPGWQSKKLMGTYDHVGTMVTPDSLYMAQMKDKQKRSA